MLIEVDRSLNSGLFTEATALLNAIQLVADDWPDAAQREQLLGAVRTQRRRLRAREKRARKERTAKVRSVCGQNSTQANKPRKRTVNCESCGQPYGFYRSDPTKFCDICRPRKRRSVTAISGGLPGLGKRR
jgi:ribosomal protein S14